VEETAHCCIPTISFFLDMKESCCRDVVDYKAFHSSVEQVCKSNN